MREREDARRRILVVEDDADTREYLRDLLAIAGFDVDVAADADGARALVALGRPSLLLVDVSLPRESGTSLLRDLRARRIEAPALFVTARVDVPEGGDGLVSEVIRKPFHAGELLEAIERALDDGS